MVDIHTGSTPLDEAADTLNGLLTEIEGKDVLLLISGGSAMGLVERLHPHLVTLKHTVSVLDERYTNDEAASNFTALTRTSFYKIASDGNVLSIDPRPQDMETLQETAKRFDLALKHWHITHQDGIVIATMGIGEDGHTSGVLPMPEDKERFTELFLSEHKCAVGYRTTPEKNPYTDRVTTTLSYMRRHIDHAVVYATGAAKRDTLKQVLNSEDGLAEMPARIIHKLPDARLFTDQKL
jgi:6-phosphogluconolactonase/glucosamine-6-phosphate isomerase/deaminase